MMKGGSENVGDRAQRPHSSTTKVGSPAECGSSTAGSSTAGSSRSSSTQSDLQSSSSIDSIGSSGSSQSGSQGSVQSSCLSGNPSSGRSSSRGGDTFEDSEAALGPTPSAHPGAREREERAQVNAEILYDDYFHAMDMAGVPDELVKVWAEDEVKLLGMPARIAREPPAGGELAEPVPQRAREVCLVVLHQFVSALQLDLEAWFEAVSMLDAYIAASRCRVGELPDVCAVLVRMLYKEGGAGRDYGVRDFSLAPAHFAQFLAAEGLMEVQEDRPLSADEFLRKEQEVLSALGWKIRLPSLAKWTEAFFRRLAVSVGSAQKDQVAALRHDCMANVRSLMILFPPSLQFPPQRVARGLLVLYSSRGRISPTPWRGPWGHAREQGSLQAEALAYLQSFEGVLGAAPQALLQDCQLAGRALQSVGMATAAAQPDTAPAAAPPTQSAGPTGAARGGAALHPRPAPRVRQHDI